MKVVALKPHFVVEAPAGEETGDAERVRRRLSPVRVSELESTSSEEPVGGGGSEQGQSDLRSGLTRLADFIKKKRREIESSEDEVRTSFALPKAELKETPATYECAAFTRLILAWKNRIPSNPMAKVFADEFLRRRALQIYRRSAKSRSTLVISQEVTSTDRYL